MASSPDISSRAEELGGGDALVGLLVGAFGAAPRSPPRCRIGSVRSSVANA